MGMGLLDHVIRPLQQRRRDRQAEGLGGLQIYHERPERLTRTLYVGRRSRSCATAATNSVTLMGLLWYPSNPAAMIFCRSSLITDAVMAMTGISRVVGSARSCLSASIPSMTGSRMYIRTRIGQRSRA